MKFGITHKKTLLIYLLLLSEFCSTAVYIKGAINPWRLDDISINRENRDHNFLLVLVAIGTGSSRSSNDHNYRGHTPSND